LGLIIPPEVLFQADKIVRWASWWG
jgi:hypothetical protein